MSDYLRIARAYLCTIAVAVWCFMLFCLLLFSAVGEELARDQGAILLGGVFSRKSYMAMFAYFNACLLGVLLRDNIACTWASVLPRYRRKHLWAASLIALLLLGVPMFAMEFVGTSDIAPMSVGVIFLTCLAAGLWTLHHPALGVLAFPFLAFVFAPSSSSSTLTAFLVGTTPVLSATLAAASLLALGVLAWRLSLLKEGMFEYAIARVWGDLLRGRGQLHTMADYSAALPADSRAALQSIDPSKNPFSNLKQVDKLSGYRERSLWQRLQLWRLGTAPTRTAASVAWLMLLTLIIIPPMVYIQRSAGAGNPARDAVVIFSVQVMTNPVVIWLPWFLRLQRLGYESLRPRARHEFVRELGLAFLWDILQCWLGGVLFMGISAAIWAPELLQGRNIFLFILGSGVGQLCAFAMMGTWLLKLLNRGMAASVACAFFPFLAAASWMLFFVMNESIGVEVKFAIALILAMSSLATVALSYGRWRRADLA